MITDGRLLKCASGYARLAAMLVGVAIVAALASIDTSAQSKSFYYQHVVTTATGTTPGTPGVSLLPYPLVNQPFPFNPTVVAIAPPPDGRLFFATVDGRIFAVTLNSNLEVVGSAQVYDAIHNYGYYLSPSQFGRMVTGMAFASNRDLYVSHSDGRFYNSDIDPFSGMVSRLLASNNYAGPPIDVVTGLPRSKRDHGPNGLAFGPYEFLYLAQAGMTNGGLPGYPADEFWGLPDTVDSGTILKINPGLVNSYTTHATGFRNPYKPLFHSNGALYVNDNGANDGGRRPVYGNCNTNQPGEAQDSTPDRLYSVQPGAFHWFPNLARGECYLDPWWRPMPLHEYSPVHTASSGLAEYVSTALVGLTGSLFTAQYATGHVVNLWINTPTPSVALVRTGFTNPLDVTVSSSGHVFVAEFAGMGVPGRISVLRALPTTPVDFNGDRWSELTIFRPETNTWWTLSPQTGGGLTGIASGTSGVIPRPGDVDGDAQWDRVSWHPTTGIWTIKLTATGYEYTFAHGSPGDIPMTADFDGDSRADQAIFRPSNRYWYIRYANTGAILGYQWGENGDIPRPMDVDGDGAADLGVFRPSDGTWHILPYGSVYNPYNPANSLPPKQWGASGDIPVPADYDGDGKTDIAFYRPSSGVWSILPAWSFHPAHSWSEQWGASTDIPRPLDYDKDGKADLVVWRPSTGEWYIVTAANNYYPPSGISVPHGGPTDIPVHPVF